MSYAVEVLCDSVPGEDSGLNRPQHHRLTTLAVTMPRFILAEFNTHRVFSRNSASSRAIPVEKRVSAVLSDPFIPEAFHANKRGMQAGEALDAIAQDRAKDIWVRASKSAAAYALELAKVGIHKQWANRVIEPFAWHTVICTSTEWENFLHLRQHPAAQPEIQVVAKMMREALDASTPNVLSVGQWHMPYITEEDINEAWDPSCEVDDKWLLKLSVARTARVSYLTHDTNKRDTAADERLHDDLLLNRHLSPFEHCAMVVFPEEYLPSNFSQPWLQYRKQIPNEAIFRG